MQLILFREGLDTERAVVTIFSTAKYGTRSLTCPDANVIVNGTECAIRTILKTLGSSHCRVTRAGQLASWRAGRQAVHTGLLAEH